MTRVSDPLVLLVVDEAFQAPLAGALLGRAPPVRVEVVAADDVVELCATRRVDLLVLSADVDDTAGTRLLTEVQAFSSPPRAVVLFTTSDDPRRPQVVRAGAWEFVLPSSAASIGTSAGGALEALLALIDRLLISDARDARLDAQGRQFRALVEASSDGIYILQNGSFTWANRRFQEMVGYSNTELTAPGFSMGEQLVAPASRAWLDDRGRRVDAGLVVEPRYEFRAQRRTGEAFDAQVSIAYLDLDDGKAGALGIMQDITERKSFEDLLLQKNKELQHLNALSSVVQHSEGLDQLLHLGCTHLTRIFGAGAAGISLLSTNRRTLTLKVSAHLPDDVANDMQDLPWDSPSLLATAVRMDAIAVVDDLADDHRIILPSVRALPFKSAIVVPLRRRGTTGDVVIGAAFCMLPIGRILDAGDRDLMIAIGNVLGSAIERAALLESEQRANIRLVALDEIAMALSSTLDPDDVALTVARSVHRIFGATRVMIATLDNEGGFFVPQHVLDDGESVAAFVPLPCDDTIMGIAADSRAPVQRVRPREGVDVSINPVDGRAVQLRPYEAALFRQGVGTAVAIPVIIDNVVTGALWLGYASTTPLAETELHVLSAIGIHVAIATKNAMLFSSRERALEKLHAAQQKLVDSEKLNAIGLIAHGVAHDFNNVLGSILGRAQLLRSQTHEATLLKHAEIIEQAARDGAETVRRIQEIGRQEQDDDFVPVGARSILDDVIELTRPRTDSKGVTITAVGDETIRVAGNPSELREVLINLVHNAVDALPAEGGQIHLTTSLADHNTVRIDVVDNGLGIPEEVIGRIFDPYFTTKGQRGTGLGLSVSHSIIRRHGGVMLVHSQRSGPAQGTTFTLTLPALQHVDDVESTSTDLTTAGSPRRAHVLVVDDEENIREILAEMLMTANHEVITAADGAEALHKLQSSPQIDLVFTDLGLPGMSGYELAQEMKRLRPDLVVGLVTGWGATLDPEKAREHGVDLVVSKPFRFEQLLAIVDEAMRTRH